MKTKIKVIVIILGLILIINLAFFFRNKKSEEFEEKKKTDFTIEQELDKSYQIIKFIEFENSRVCIFDPYGDTLKTNEWYVFSKISQQFIPIIYSADNISPIDLDLAQQGKGNLSINGEIKSDTINLHAPNYYGTLIKVKCVILFFGDRTLKFGEQHTKYYFE
jgi:hypothetical protein